MKRSSRITSISLLALGCLSLLLISPAAEARRGGKRLEQLAGQLGVDDATKGQIKQMLAQSRAEAQPIRAQLRQERRALRQLMRQDAPSEAAVLSQIDTVGALKLKLKKLKMTTMLRVRQLLTPDQRRALRELRKGKRAELRKACGAELSGVCAKAQGRKKLHCLARHLDQLSPTCRGKVVDGFGRRGHHGRHGRGF